MATDTSPYSRPIHHDEGEINGRRCRHECKGATLEQYDEVLAKMGRAPRGRGAPGSLFHWVTATDDGIRVTDDGPA